jgi:hypothetical protein
MVYELRYGNHRLDYGTVYELLEELEESCKVSRDVLAELAYRLYCAKGEGLFISQSMGFEVKVKGRSGNLKITKEIEENA